MAQQGNPSVYVPQCINSRIIVVASPYTVPVQVPGMAKGFRVRYVGTFALSDIRRSHGLKGPKGHRYASTGVTLSTILPHNRGQLKLKKTTHSFRNRRLSNR